MALSALRARGRADVEANKELVRRHFDEIWNQRNMVACEELMAADFVENAAAPFAPMAPGRVNGPAAMRGTVAWLTTQFPTCGWSWNGRRRR